MSGANRETLLTRSILQAIGFRPDVVVCNIPPAVHGKAALRYFDVAIARFDAIQGPAIFVLRQNTGTRKSADGRRAIRMGRPGAGDLEFFVKPWGVYGEWEIKTPKGTLREAQRVNKRMLDATGALFAELRSVEDAHAAVDEAIGKCRIRFGRAA